MTKKRKQKRKIINQKKLPSKKNLKKIKQEKELELPEVDDQWQILNTDLAKVNMGEISKVNRKGRKFSAKVVLPRDLIIGNEHISKVNKNSVYPPHFGLDSKLVEKYAGWRHKERGREHQLMDEPDPPNVQDPGGGALPVNTNHKATAIYYDNVDQDQVMTMVTLPKGEDRSKSDDENR